MLENFTDWKIAAGLTALAVFCFMICVQYSRFTDHKKKHAEDEKDSKSKALADKFAFVPYFFFPLFFVGLSTALTVIGMDYVIVEGYISNSGFAVIATASAGVVIYGIIDKYCLARTGNALYFDMIESKFHGLVENIVLSDEEVVEAIEAYKRKKK